MAVTSVGSNPASNSSNGAQSGTTTNPTLNLSQGQFLQLLTAQLQNQDPLNPVSSTDFTTQMSQLSTVSGIQQMNANLQQMLQMQQLSQGAALVGKSVSYGTGSNAGSGVVQGVSLNNGALQVQVNGQSISSGQITGIVQGGKS